MSEPLVIPTVSVIDHERLRRIASAGMRVRRAPPSAQFLAGELERARVVNPAALPQNVISMHSVFDFRDGITDRVRRGVLVYPGEEEAGAGRISVLSPLGAALIGLAEGQSFQWRSATGVQRTLRVIRVVYRAESTDTSEACLDDGAIASKRSDRKPVAP